jgi:outer membrane protein insertion porin family
MSGSGTYLGAMRQQATIRRLVSVAFMMFLTVSLPSADANAQFDRATLRWINNKPKVREIHISGNTFFSSEEIRNRLFSQEYSFLSNLKNSRNVILHRETIVRDTSEIKAMYLREGFLGIKVLESFEALVDSSARIRIQIIEGTRFMLGPVEYLGEIPKNLRGRLGNPTKLMRRKGPVNLFSLRQVQLNLKELFANSGYPFARIDYRVDTAQATGENHLTPVRFEIATDSLVHFGSVEILGAETFGEGAAKRELKIKPGALYRRKDIQDTQRRLLRSGYYTTIQLRVKDSSETGASFNRLRPDFSVRVKEKRPQFVTLRGGVAQDSVRDLVWEQSIGWGKRNLFGTRRIELSAEGEFVPRDEVLLSHTYRVRYVEPWFLHIRMPLSLSAEIEPGVKSQVQPFRIQRWRVDAETRFERRRKLRVVLGAQYESVEVFDIEPEALADFREQEGISVRRKLYGSIRRDSRDDIFVPRRGTVTEGKIDFFGGFFGGDANFIRVEGSWAKFQPFWKSVIRATRIKFGFAEPLSLGDDVPAIDRFFIGGANTIRGFSTDELGPRADSADVSRGSEFYLIFNEELRFPLFKKFWGSMFFDAGNGWEGIDDPNISFRRAAYSYGVGMQYLSPAGPLRLDYARRIKTRGIPFNDRLHLTILYAF